MMIESTHHLLPWVVILPLLAAVLMLLLSSHRARSFSSVAFAAWQLIAVYLLFDALASSQSENGIRYALGGWGAPLGIDLVLDGFSVLMLLMVASIGLVLTLYGQFYLSEGDQSTRFWPLWWMLMAGLNTIFVAGDIFNIYVGLELLGLAAVALVALQANHAALSAALRYLLVGLLGSLFYLMGVALIYRTYGTLDLQLLSQLAEADPITLAALALMTAGLLMKTALAPLHFWLPDAHGNAIAPVSAALSALVVKATFYLITRLWLEALAPAAIHQAMYLLGMLGVLGILWGAFKACQAERLKVLVAYSTVAQVGYLFLLFPLVALAQQDGELGTSALAWVGYYIVAHALAKSAMFLAVGNMVKAAGDDRISNLVGVSQHQPLSLMIFAIAGASLIGLPPSGGFIGKWMLLNLAIEHEQWGMVVVLLVGGLMASYYVFKVLNIGFSNQPEAGSESVVQQVSISPMLSVCGLILAIWVFLYGFAAQRVLQLMEGVL